MSCVVADSGPLIALACVDCLRLPQQLWGRLLVPQTVLEECSGMSHKSGADRILHATQSGLIEVVADEPLDAAILDYGLDSGESQAIGLAHRIHAILLIDERRGRKTASSLDIPHIGTCGLLVQAKRATLIPQVRPLLDGLLAADYFLAQALVQDTLRLAGESTPRC